MSEPAAKPLVCVVDDDEALRDSLRWLLESEGYRVTVCQTAEAFLSGASPGDVSCLLLDVRMPGLSGLELQQELNRRGHWVPTIFITGHGDVPMAVNALKEGAFDFIEKPFNDAQLLGLVSQAVATAATTRMQHLQRCAAAARLRRLTPREREIVELIVSGQRNKQIADALGLSIKTIEAHRARIMEKMQVRTLAELVQATLAGHQPSPAHHQPQCPDTGPSPQLSGAEQ